MKKVIIISLICFFITLFTSAQGNYPVHVNKDAHYPQGDVALMNYFNQNITYSPEAIKNKVYGKVVMSFTVKTDSTISDVFPLSDIGYGMEEEVSRCLKKLKYAPAIVNGVVYPANLIINVVVKAEESK